MDSQSAQNYPQEAPWLPQDSPREAPRKHPGSVIFKSESSSHSMAMGNLNKSKETKPITTTELKVAP